MNIHPSLPKLTECQKHSSTIGMLEGMEMMSIVPHTKSPMKMYSSPSGIHKFTKEDHEERKPPFLELREQLNRIIQEINQDKVMKTCQMAKISFA